MMVIADIGGTTTRVARSVDEKTFDEPTVFDTVAHNFETGIQNVIHAARSVAHNETIDRCVIGIAGRFSDDYETLLDSAHLPGWEKHNLAQTLRDALGCSVLIQNDVALGALGEANEGAGAGAHVVTYIAVGTGIGGRKVVGGYLDESDYRSVGHQSVTIDGVTKRLEEFVSGTTVMKEHGVRASDLDNPAEWDRYARAFAHGLHATLLAWSPERVMLGGTLCSDTMLSIPRIKKHLATLRTDIPEIVYATLPYPGLTGALVYAKQKTAV